MASKYAGLKGTVPYEQPELTEKQIKINAAVKERAEKPMSELTAEFNALTDEADEIAEKAAGVKTKLDAIEICIRKKLIADDNDHVGSNGYTWSESLIPLPVATGVSPASIVKYFNDNGMSDMLNLTITELGARLKKVVKEEADANELIVKQVPDPDNPGKQKTEVFSKVPGVKVYLKPSLSRVKSGKAKKSKPVEGDE